MLYCNKCQLQFKEGRFCSECGSSLQKIDKNRIEGNDKNYSILAEIIGWIQNKLTRYAVVEITYDLTTYSTTTNCLSSLITNFNRSSLQLTITFEITIESEITNRNSKSLHIQDYVIDMSKLTLEVAIQKLQGSIDAWHRYLNVYELILNSQPNQNAISMISNRDNEEDEHSENLYEKLTCPEFLSSIAIIINDKNMAERIAKAFHDAIELAGGKSELY